MKNTQIEIKNSLQENSSTVGEAKNEINDLKHKEANTQSEPKGKKEFKEIEIV